MVHHLHESVFLGDVTVAATKLARASALARLIEAETTRSYIDGEVCSLREMLEAWAVYQQGDQSVGFAQWCEAQAHEFRFLKSYYYTE